MGARATKRYDREFKLGAVKLVVEEGKSVRQVAEDLGISGKSLYSWIKEYEADKVSAFPGSGNPKAQEDENKRLREENRLLRMERDLLKKTFGYFVDRPK